MSAKLRTEPQVSTSPDIANSDANEWTLSTSGAAQMPLAPDTTNAWLTLRVKRPEGRDSFQASCLQRSPDGDRTLLGLLSGVQANGGFRIGSKLQAGYGRPFQDDSVLVRSNNGNSREEPGCFYLKTCFRF